MPTPLTVSDVAREISVRTGCPVRPADITLLFYGRKLDDARCPIVGRNRLIPRDYVASIEAVLRERGLLREATNAS